MVKGKDTNIPEDQDLRVGTFEKDNLKTEDLLIQKKTTLGRNVSHNQAHVLKQVDTTSKTMDELTTLKVNKVLSPITWKLFWLLRENRKKLPLRDYP